LKTGDVSDNESGGGGNDDDDDYDKENCGSICHVLKMSLVAITKALF
jgi:hypothetical protein